LQWSSVSSPQTVLPQHEYGDICRSSRYSCECGGCRVLSYTYIGNMFADEPQGPYVIENKWKKKS